LVSGDHEQIDCVVVEKLNTKLIVGLPGIDKLDPTINYHIRRIWKGGKPVDTVGGLPTVASSNTVMTIDIDQDLIAEQRKQMSEVIEKWKTTLVETIEDKGAAKDSEPIYVPLRTYSPKEQEELDRQIEDMLHTILLWI